MIAPGRTSEGLFDLMDLFGVGLNPKEEMTVGHRLDPWMATVTGKLKAHGATFRKYPSKNIGL